MNKFEYFNAGQYLLPMRCSGTASKESNNKKRSSIGSVVDVGRGIIGQRRTINAIGFVVCAMMLTAALFLQYSEGLPPCPLCMAQRCDVVVLGLVFLVAAIRDKHRRCYGFLIMIVAGFGATMAGYQVWLQHQLPAGPHICLPPLSILLDSFPLAQVIGAVLQSPGDCSKVHWTFMGLSIPAWTLIIFTGLGVIGTIRNWRKF